MEEEWIKGETETPIPITGRKLFRINMITYSNGTKGFLLNIHHIISDGWTIGLIGDQIKDRYEKISDKENDLPNNNPSYLEYIISEEKYIESDRCQSNRNFWKEYLSGAPVPIEYPIAFMEQCVKKADRFVHYLPEELSGELNDFCRRNKLSLFSLFMTAIGVYFHRITGSQDFIIGTASHNRTGRSEKQTAGMFVNILPYRHKQEGDISFADLLKQVSSDFISLFRNQKYPFDMIIKDIRSDQNYRRDLFNIVFSYENRPFELNNYWNFNGVESFPLVIHIVEREGSESLKWEIDYHKDLFRYKEIESLFNSLMTIVKDGISNPDKNTGQLNLVSSGEQMALLNRFNSNRLETPEKSTISGLFSKCAKKSPGNLALVYDKEKITYKQLDNRSDSIAIKLQKKGIGKNSIVGILSEPSIEMITAILSVLKAGGAYLPIDPAYPKARIAYMLSDSRAEALLIQKGLTQTGYTGSEVIVIDNETLVDAPAHPIPVNTEADDPVYLIYTSGSTGHPKGVIVEHRNLVNLCLWHMERFKLTERDNTTKYAGVGFDASAWEIFPTLLAGATLHIIDRQTKRDINKLNHYFHRNDITVSFLPTAICEPFTKLENSSLRYLLTGGDKLNWFEPGSYELINNYGPTECTVVATSCTLKNRENGIPIGTPIANTRVYILDSAQRLLPRGVPGEICIGGAGVARGYLNKPELTAEKFIPDPFRPGERIYRTGDLARWLPDGELEFLGRIDHQIKIRGYRIEPGEIESSLAGFTGVQETVVEAVEEKAGKYLCAYVVSSGEVTRDDLEKHLSAELPDYMIPSRFVFLDALPLTANGKVDRKVLPELQAGSSPGKSCLAPVTDREKLLVRVWEEILGQSPVGIKDNFFYRGGDSIKAIQMASELQKNGYTLPVPAIYEYPTIQELQDSLTTLTEAVSDKPVTGPAPLTPIQKWFFEQNLPNPHHWNQQVTIDSPAGDNPGILRQSLKELILHHDALRTVFPDDGTPFVRGEDEPLFYFTLLPEERHSEVHNRLDLNNGPLLAAALDSSVSPARVGIVIHHLVVDGISWRILLEDLRTLCSSLLEGRKPVLPPKTAPFNQWALALEEYAASHLFRREIPYWEKLENTPTPPLREGRPAGTCTKGEMAQWEINLDSRETAALLNDCHHAYNTEINDLLLCALSRAFAKWNNVTPLYLNMEGHGRNDLGDGRDTSRSVGWFTSSYPVLLEGGKEEDLSRQIPAVKETLRKIPRKGIGYGIIRYLSNPDKSGFPCLRKTPEVSFNYLGVFNELTGLELSMAPDCPVPYPLDINGLVESGALRLIFAYNSRRFDETAIRELAEQYKKQLRGIIRHCGKRKESFKTPWDYGDCSLTGQEVDRLPPKAVRVCSLTPLQEGMLLAHIRNPRTGTYFEQLSFSLSGRFDRDLFESRWQALLDRHEILRTIFLYEGLQKPRQVVLKQTENPVEYRDISHLTGSEKRECISRYREKDRDSPFTLTESPPCRLRVLREEDLKHKVLFSFHHILLDGWCLGIFLKEMFLGDSAPIRGDYYKFLQWREERNHEASSLYWKDYLEGYETRTALPGKKEGRGCSQKEKLFILSEKDTAGLTGWAGEQGTTPATVFQAVWGLLLQRYNSTDDVVFGFVDSGRPPEVADADRMMGLFINTVPVRVKSRPEMTFADLIRQIQERYSRSQEHSYYPLAEIQSDTGWKDGLINHIVAFENYPLPAELQEMISDVEVFEQADYDFNLLVLPEDRLEVRIRYNEEAFAEDQVEECGRRLLALLKSIPGQGNVLLDEMELLSRKEQDKLKAFSVGPVSPYPLKTIHQVYRERAGEIPGRTALVYGEQEMSYGMLDSKTDTLAAYLTGQEISPGSVIAVVAYRSLEMVIAVLGVLKAGCTYLPIDPDMPEERMRYILKDSGAGHMIVPAERDKCAVFNGKVYSLDSLPPMGNRESGTTGDISSESPAYIIYTSGSSGKPKGVVVEHRNAVNTLFALQEAYPLNEGDAFLLKTPYSFDVSVAELFGWFFGRGKLIILNPGEEKEPDKILRMISRHRVTHINFVPSMLYLFLEGLEEKDIPALENLRYLFSAGEALTREIARKFHSLTKKIHLENLYGPTEAAIYATGVSIQPGDEDSITIGRPLANTSAFILDARNRPVPPGIPGELCLSGAGITRGYLNRRELTEERFVPSPFATGEKMYRTGDLTRWTPTGDIEYLGRVDNQVKIRGNRVELGEIETCLASYENIDKALVIDRDDAHGLKYLAAYYLSSGNPTQGEIRNYIAKTLPSYMIPAFYIKLDSFPLTTSGKLDRKKLPGAKNIILSGEESVAPRNEQEEDINAIWQDVLGIKRIGVHDNFFDLGGDSIKAIQVYSRLTEKYDISMTDIFEYETVAALSSYILNRLSDFKKRIEKIRARAAENNTAVDLSFVADEMNRYALKNNRYLMMDLSSQIKYRHILLTGATGYLGCHMLRDLLEETDATIHALVRGASAGEAESRLRRQLEFYFDRDLFSDYSDRIVLRTGDMGMERFGMAEEDYADLSKEIDCIINCAANVRHYGHYEDFEQINIKGVERLVALALEGRKKDVNHISTMSVGLAGMRGRKYFLFNEYKTDLDPDFDNVYIKSKLEAEKLVLKARDRGLRANIFRVGNLVFNKETGQFQKNIHENAFYTSVKSFIKLGSYPKIKHNTLDFSYVDYSSKAIVLLFDKRELENEVHHIANPHTISINKLGALIGEAGYPLKVRDINKFLDFMYANHSNRAAKEHIQNILLHSHIIENPDTVGLVQQNLKTTQILQRMDFSCRYRTGN